MKVQTKYMYEPAKKARIVNEPSLRFRASPRAESLYEPYEPQQNENRKNITKIVEKIAKMAKKCENCEKMRKARIRTWLGIKKLGSYRALD